MSLSEKDYSDFEKGEVYTGDIERISRKGNGLISIKSGWLNLGPTDPKYSGESVRFVFRGKENCIILGKVPQNPLKDDYIGNKNNLLNGNQ